MSSRGGRLRLPFVAALTVCAAFLLAPASLWAAAPVADQELEETCVAAVTAPPDPFELAWTKREAFVGPIHGYQLTFTSGVEIGVQELPAVCHGAFRATGTLFADYKDAKHKGWWLDASGGVSFLRPESKAGVRSFILTSSKDIGCFQAVRLGLSVKVLNLSNGATAAKRTFRRPAQPLTCSGQPKQARTLAAFDPLPPLARREIDPAIEAECIEVATAEPTGREATLNFRNDIPRGERKRERWRNRFFLPAMPKECAGAIGRYFFASIQIQDAQNPDRWRFQNRKKWWAPDNSPDAHWWGRGWSHTGETDDWVRAVYECSPGPRETEARVLIKARAYAREGGQPTVAQRNYEVPVKVTGAC